MDIEKFSSEILVVVTTYNRPKITELALRNLSASSLKAGLWILDDHSTEYDLDFLRAAAPHAERVERREKKVGIDHQRFLCQLEAFETDYKYIYHTDNDAFHDPDWIARLCQIHTAFKNVPICLYNTVFHIKNTMKIVEELAVALRKFCPGISFFYPQSLLQPSASRIKQLLTSPLTTNWDFYFGTFLGKPTATSLMSYVEHFGAGGIHNSDYDRDRAFSPTPYLLTERQKIIEVLLT